MERFDNITIKNFKSLNDVTIRGCKTFNLFIGRPNVGKSNIIEALSLFSIPYAARMRRNIGDFLRIEQTPSMFYDGNTSTPISVSAGDYKITAESIAPGRLKLKYETKTKKYDYEIADLKTKKLPDDYPVFKPYNYDFHIVANKKNHLELPFLCPWDGNNMMQVVQNNVILKDYFAVLLKEFDLQLTFDMTYQEIRVLKPLSNNSSCILPYNSLADSIKRLMFYKAAINSNCDSVLMFEELEAHAYPPYISKIAREIIDNPDNQYFITTHSPYVVNEFLEDTTLDVAIHLVDFKEGCTIVKTLSDSEIDEVYNYGIDLFFNTEAFL